MANDKTIADIFDSNELHQHLSKHAYRHTYYYHYSDISGIKGILKDKVLWLSQMTDSNDMNEHTCFDDKTYTYFQFCFTTGTTENLPMWFLYSGRNGNGARISIPKNSIEKLIDLEHLSLFRVKKDGTERKKLTPDRYDAQFKDILYYKKENDKVRLKHNTRVNNQFPSADFNEYENGNQGFLKDIIWFYEKETRLLVKVSSEELDPNFHWRLELKIPEAIFNDMKVTLSPKYFLEDENQDEKEVIKKAGLEEYIERSSLSKNAGKININLCKHCKD